MKPLALVIPVFNEAENIDPLLREIYTALEDHTAFEVIVVDDASQDETPQRLRQLRGQLPNLRVIHHTSNSGQSAALLTGVRAAASPWIITLDGDGQNDPADIPRLLAERDAAQPLPQLVAGYRQQRNDNWIRRLASLIANRVRGWLLSDHSPDTGCGLKLLSRHAFMALPHFNHMHRFLPALIQRNGGIVLTVAVNHRPRRYGRSKYAVFDRLWVGIIDMIGVLWLQRRPCTPHAWEEEHCKSNRPL